jgi:hypothetical protein
LPFRPEKDTEIFFDRTTPTFRCALQFNGKAGIGKSKCLVQYQNEDIFVVCISGVEHRISCGYAYTKAAIHLSCAKHRNFGLKVEDIYCSSILQGYNQWFKMEANDLKNKTELLLQRFIIRLKQQITFGDRNTYKFTFDIKTISTIGNYYYEMMDENWLTDLWAAAINQKLTDVEIFVGTVKVMEAHRVILSARSPVLNILLNKVSSDATKSIVTFGPEFNVDIVTLFLQFLYTGSLEPSASKDPDYKQLLELAKIYEVESLKNFCQVANAVSPDVEDLTSSLLEL